MDEPSAATAADLADLVIVGRITTVYGVKGWVKIHSYTEPMDNILGFEAWHLWRNGTWQPVNIAGAKRHQKGLIAALEGVTDREQARAYCQCDIAVPSSEMPALDNGEYYWHQLEGLAVYAPDEQGQPQRLGRVDHLMETGANDVLVVRPDRGSVDDRERLIPWLPDQVVRSVDLDGGRIDVDWDIAF